MRPETALVTGSSSGIGLELARLFAADRSNLVLVARSGDKLDELAAELTDKHGIEATVVVADLSRRDAPQQIESRLRSEGIDIDVVVNNAGFGAVGRFAATDRDRQLDMIQVNVTALTDLTRRFLPPMIARGRGGILNVASLAGFQPGPLMSVYYATKAYVLSLTEALAEELAGTGVRVCCLAPGPSPTNFQDGAGIAGPRSSVLGSMPAEEVARAGYRGLRRGQTIVLPGHRVRFVAHAGRLLPRSFVRRMVKKLNSRHS